MNQTAVNNALDLSRILQKLIRRKGLNVAELARQINMPQPTIQRIVAGIYKRPRITTLYPIAEYFNISISQLYGIDPIPFLQEENFKLKSLPLLTLHQVNKLPQLARNISRYVICDSNFGNNAFAMHMPDCSMEPVFNKGTILLIDPSRTPQHKSYIVIKKQKPLLI